MAVTDDDFVSLDASQLTLPRKSDGSLPYVEFLRLKTNSKLYNAGMGCFLTGAVKILAMIGWKMRQYLLREMWQR